MQKLFTKNVAIVVLALLSLTCSAYIAVKWWKWSPTADGAKPTTTQPERTAIVEVAPILRNDGPLQACYETFLKKSPSIDEGAVRLHFSIKKTGEIEGLKLASTELNDEEFTTCLIEEVSKRRVQVTPERLGVMINHKLNFKRRTPASIEY